MGEPKLKDLFLEQTSGQHPAGPVSTKPTIQKLNFSHEAIIRWLLENPTLDQGDCARHFGYTQAWLSIIIHSDAFQAKYREMQQSADALVINDIPAKLRGVASLALEALGDQVEAAIKDKTVAPRDFLLKTSESLLKSLGYGQGTKVTINQGPGSAAVVVPVESDALQRARDKLVERRGDHARVIDGESSRVPETPTT